MWMREIGPLFTLIYLVAHNLYFTLKINCTKVVDTDLVETIYLIIYQTYLSEKPQSMSNI